MESGKIRLGGMDKAAMEKLETVCREKGYRLVIDLNIPCNKKVFFDFEGKLVAFSPHASETDIKMAIELGARNL